MLGTVADCCSQGLQLSSANLVQVLRTPQVNTDSSTSDDESTTVTSVCTMPAPRPLPLPQRPQVGMKIIVSTKEVHKCNV